MDKLKRQMLTPEDLVCAKCGIKFSTELAIVQHQYLERHLGLYCYVCKKTFTETANLKRHIQSIHYGQLQRCTLCNIACNREDNLLNHQLRWHGMMLCKFCGSGFTHKKHLSDHISQYHRSWCHMKRKRLEITNPLAFRTARSGFYLWSVPKPDPFNIELFWRHLLSRSLPQERKEPNGSYMRLIFSISDFLAAIFAPNSILAW